MTIPYACSKCGMTIYVDKSKPPPDSCTAIYQRLNAGTFPAMVICGGKFEIDKPPEAEPAKAESWRDRAPLL